LPVIHSIEDEYLENIKSKISKEQMNKSINKWANEPNRHFLKEEEVKCLIMIQKMFNICSYQGNENKTALRFHLSQSPRKATTTINAG
jgi:hypothetical protein